MSLAKIFSDIPLLIILSVFISSFIYMVQKYRFISSVLKDIANALMQFDRNNLSYKFEEFKALMMSNYFTRNSWEEFQNTLMFSDITLDNGMQMEDTMSSSASEIKTTAHVEDYFNVGTLVYNHYNRHIIQIVPTILTGFGPLFTFVIIGTAFGHLDFSAADALMKSISGFVETMQLAAMCSVVAVASSLIFMTIEKFGYSKFILPHVITIQTHLTSLFKPVSEEQFLIDLLIAVKNQNNSSADLMQHIPEKFTTSIKRDMTNMIIPYLDSIITGMNSVNSTIEKSMNSDNMDDLF